MKIVLFDLVLSGHHLIYATHIMKFLIEQGDEVTFLTWKPDQSLAAVRNLKKPINLKYVTRNSKEKFGGNTQKRLIHSFKGIRHCYKLAAQKRADVVHCLYIDRSELPLLFNTLGKSRPWKLFATLFWPYFIHELSECVGLPKHIFHTANRNALSLLLKQGKLNGLFVHTDRIKKMLLNSFSDKSLNQRIFIIPDPIEPLEIMPQKVARSQLGLPKRNPLILFFGGLRWDKGPDILLQALSQLEGEWITLLAGKPQHIEEKEVNQYRNLLKGSGRLISHLMYIPDNDVAKYFSAADVVILPYRKAFKGTSGILQHAAAAGKPIIATDVGEIGSIVRENRLGIVVEPESPTALAQGIREFLTKKDELSKKVRSKALQYAEASNYQISAKKVRDAYLATVKG